ncbi:uncharacterized protein F4822DRAFT_394286 [Hypoxylon trugodes]|uniref:uncharacterized protein n=1 Tax=Hypoxylon trugodes TaxID=326681 RepID=UPI00219F4CE9|nr:uncharacterized protein F4822DRAFT_394286 [Hypoxylon trugodes]KAI1390722.1 hypothetical protein F4822DRAFT_394286 [Hypoxylon trugodes]
MKFLYGSFLSRGFEESFCLRIDNNLNWYIERQDGSRKVLFKCDNSLPQNAMGEWRQYWNIHNLDLW